MAFNLSVDSSEIENLLRECDAIVSKYQDLESSITEDATSESDLRTLKNEINTICANVSAHINGESSSNAPVSETKTECDSTLSNNRNIDENDDIVFMGRWASSDIPVIDLCSPNNDYVPRKRLLNTDISELEVIEINESSSENKRSKLPKDKSAKQSERMVRCPICLESVFKRIPTTTTCGHVFCFKCISLALKSNKKCPLCKQLRPKLVKLYGLDD